MPTLFDPQRSAQTTAPLPAKLPTVDGKASPAVFHYLWTLLPQLPAARSSPAQVVFAGQTVDELTQQPVTVYAPSPSDKVLVSITGDTSGGRLSAAFVTTLTLPVFPSPQGPRPPAGSPPQTKTEQILSPTTRATQAGEALNLQVSFSAGSMGSYSANLVIQGDGWQPLTIPITAAVTHAAPTLGGGVTGSISGVAINTLYLPQGGSAILGVRISSTATEPAEVQLVYEPIASDQIGLSMQPMTVTVPAGGTLQTGLTFAAAVDAVVIGNAPLTIYGQAPGMSCTVGGAAATVTYGPVSVVPQGPGSPQPSLGFTQGTTGTITLSVTVAGSATEIAFNMQQGPPGVALLESPLFPVAAASTQQLTLQFSVAQGAPINFSGLPLALNWIMYGAKVTGSVGAKIYIFGEFQCNGQQESNWCWAATTVNIANYYVTASGFTQCFLAGDILGIDGCCANPGACNQPYDVEQSLKVTGNYVASYTAPPYYTNTLGPLAMGDLEGQVNQGLPVAIRIQWEAGSADDDYQHPAHAIVVSNQDSDFLFVIDDPFFGVSAVPYETLVSAYQGNGIWTHAYTTTAGSTAAGFAA